MPNYSLQVDNRRYDPTAFLNAAREDQKEQEADLRAAEISYGELSSKANMLEKLANDIKGKDSEAYKTYMNYANSLRQHTNMLATNGLNPSTFKNIIQAKNDYSRMISPIEEAWTAREKESVRQAEYLKQHPDAIFERDARDMSIDQWMKNPHYTAKSIDKNALATRAAGAFSQFKKKLQDFVSQNGLDPNDTKSANLVKQWVKAGKVPWLYQALEKYGMNPDDVDKVMAGDPAYDNHILNKIINSELRSSGVLNWDTSLDHFDDEQNRQYLDNKIDEVRSAIVAQTPYAIGEDKFDKHTDSESAQVYRTKLEIAARADEAEKERKWKERQAAIAKLGDKVNKEDWYINRISNYNNPKVQTSEANFLRQMTKFAVNSGLQNKSTNYIEFLLDKIGIDRESIESGTVDVNSPEIIKAVQDLHKSGKYKEQDANNFGWRQAGQELAAVGETLAYITGGLVNASLITNPLGWLMIASKGGEKLMKDANYRAKISKLYEQARRGNQSAIDGLVKEGFISTGLDYETKLKKLIDYKEDDAYDLDEQADMYIRGSATNLSGATSNWADTSQKHAGQTIFTLLNQAISKNEDKKVYDYLRDINDRSKKIEISDFNSIAGVNGNGEMTNLPQVGLNFDKDGKVKISLEFNASKNNGRAKSYEFDDRLITNGSAERAKYKAQMEEANKAMNNASKFTESEKVALHKEAAKIYNNLSSEEKKNKTENDVFKELRQRVIYKRKLVYQSAFNDAKGNFFLSLGINTHDVNTRTKGIVEEELKEVRHDPSFNDILTFESEQFNF